MKRLRADSVTEAVKAAQAAPIQAPSTVPLDPEDMPFFVEIIETRARVEWRPHEVQIAAMLARKMRDYEDLQQRIREEGYTITTEKGWPAPNPLLQGMRMLDTSIAATRRTLGIDPRAAEGEKRDRAKRRDTLKEAELDDTADDLLARPN